MKTIDFRRGRWGHALHATGFGLAPESRPEDRRYTALVHCQAGPREGDIIQYTTAAGDRDAKVLNVEWLRDPRDMYKLEFQVIEPADAGGPAK